MTPPKVDIHYLRPPEHVEVYTQALLVDDRSVKVTLATDIALEQPVMIGGTKVLEAGSAAIWFTFPDTWHDIGLFHRADGTFTGTYANVITPCVFETPTRWSCTDLFLDVWIDPDGGVQLLDEDELDAAEVAAWVTPEMAQLARKEATRLKKRAEALKWPPPVVLEWNLQRALNALTTHNPRRTKSV